MSLENLLSISTSDIRRPVPTIWVPQNLLSQRIDPLAGVRSPNIAIRLRLCAQRRWSAYDRATGLDSALAAPASGEEIEPMYSEASSGLVDSVFRCEQ